MPVTGSNDSALAWAAPAMPVATRVESGYRGVPGPPDMPETIAPWECVWGHGRSASRTTRAAGPHRSPQGENCPGVQAHPTWRPVNVAGDRTRDDPRPPETPVWEPSREHGFHALRHFYASEQLEAGEWVLSLTRWLGHTDPGFTVRKYAHFLPGAGSRGSGAIDAVFGETRPGLLRPESPRKSHRYRRTPYAQRIRRSDRWPPMRRRSSNQFGGWGQLVIAARGRRSVTAGRPSG